MGKTLRVGRESRPWPESEPWVIRVAPLRWRGLVIRACYGYGRICLVFLQVLAVTGFWLWLTELAIREPKASSAQWLRKIQKAVGPQWSLPTLITVLSVIGLLVTYLVRRWFERQVAQAARKFSDPAAVTREPSTSRTDRLNFYKMLVGMMLTSGWALFNLQLGWIALLRMFSDAVKANRIDLSPAFWMADFFGVFLIVVLLLVLLASLFVPLFCLTAGVRLLVDLAVWHRRELETVGVSWPLENRVPLGSD